jgi:hypothetical protein
MCYDPNKNIRLISPYLGGLRGLCARSSFPVMFRAKLAKHAKFSRAYFPWRPFAVFAIVFSGHVSRQARQVRKDFSLKAYFLGGLGGLCAS